MTSRMTVATAVALLLLTLSIGVWTRDFSSGPDYQVGPQSDGSVVTPANQLVTPAGTQVTFNGRPLAVAIRPDQKTAAILNTGSGQSNFATRPVIIVDLATGTVKQEFTPGTANASYDGILYSRDGAHLYFSQDRGNVVIADVAADGTLTLNATIALPSSLGTVNNGGLALSDDGMTLYVVLNMKNSVGVIDLATRQFTGSIAVQNAPKSIAVAGTYAYVTNQGGRPAKAGEVTVNSAGTAIVADPDSGASITGTVSVIDLQTRTVVKNITVGLQPSAILVSDDFVYVANSNSDSVSVIDRNTNMVFETLQVQPFHGAQFGSSPNGLALTSHNELAVTLGGNNAVAIYRWSASGRDRDDDRDFEREKKDNDQPEWLSDQKGGRHGRLRLAFEGFIPTAWYPADVAVAAAQSSQQSGQKHALPERLVVANTKGTAVGSNVPNSGTPAGKNTHTFVGSVSIIPFPSESDFQSYNRQVALNNGWQHRNDDPQRPRPFGNHGPIKHVIYVIKENRTYDQVYGDDPRGNGDPSLLQFGTRVTPNQHALADQFGLFDNFYDSGVLSADGHQWATQAFAPDYIEKQFTDFNRSYPFNGGDSLVYTPTGFIWMNAARHGKSVRIYGEYAPSFVGPSQPFPTWSDWYHDSLVLEGKSTEALRVPIGTYKSVGDVPSVQQYINPDFPNYNTGIPDQYRLDIFLKDFDQYVRNRNLPNLIVMTLCDDHTSGTSRGFPTPAAQVADNDLAVGRLVDAVSHSPYWANTAIFFVEDDSQAGVDHVDGHRSTALIVSPYARRGQLNHTYYTQVSMVRTIEELLGLSPMNQHDRLALAMTDAFSDTPDLTPFNFIPNQIPIDTLNPAPMTALQKAWEAEIAQYFPRGPKQTPDIADANLLDHAIWYATSNFSKPFPGDERILYPSELR